MDGHLVCVDGARPNVLTPKPFYDDPLWLCWARLCQRNARVWPPRRSRPRRNNLTPEQLVAWASASNDRYRWIEMLSDQHSLVAIYNGVLVGFASLAHGHHIDLLYVHRNYLRHGIATQMYLTLEETAIHFGQPMLTTHASVTSKPFFEKHGFEVQDEQIVSIAGVQMNNFRMQKMLQ